MRDRNSPAIASPEKLSAGAALRRGTSEERAECVQDFVGGKGLFKQHALWDPVRLPLIATCAGKVNHRKRLIQFAPPLCDRPAVRAGAKIDIGDDSAEWRAVLV